MMQTWNAGNMKCFEWESTKGVISNILTSITCIAVIAKWFLFVDVVSAVILERRYMSGNILYRSNAV